MAEVTLEVPAEHVVAWRDAVLVEMRNDAMALVENVESLQQEILEDRTRIENARLRKEQTDPPKQADLGDVAWPSKTLLQDFDILEDSFTVAAGTLEVTGATDALAHVCETMASKIVPPKITEATWTSPYSEEVENEIAGVVGALTWATTEASRLQALWQEQVGAEKAEVA